MTHFPPFKRTAIATACAIALGLAVLPLSSAHAEQTINIDSPVTHGVAGNSARGQAEDGWYTYDVTNVLDPNNNTVNINADVGGYVFGSVTTNGASASGNTVNISGGATVAGKTSTSIYRGVRGGYAGNDSMNVTASNNTVNINDAVIEGEDTEAVWGGFARSRGHNATASNNIVNISNADVTEGVVRGGSANSNSGTATAWGNTVNISNATVNGDVTGGSATEVGNNTSAPTLNLIASGNTVNISGNAWVTEDVTGGYAKYGTNRDRVTATNNTVNISGNALVDGHVYGGDIRQYATSSTTTAGAGDAFTGNTLNVLNAGMTVGSVQSFEKLNFTFPSTQTQGVPVLNITNGTNTRGTDPEHDTILGDGLGRNSFVTANTTGAAPMPVGSLVTLIGDVGGVGTVAGSGNGSVAPTGTGQHNATISYDWETYINAGALFARLAGVGASDESEGLLEGKVAGLVMTIDSLIYKDIAFIKKMKHDKDKPGVTSFFMVEGDSSSYDTGSSVDVEGVSIMAGAAWTNTLNFGTLMLGGFFEAGWGNYDTRNSFNNASAVMGNGDANYYAVGVFGRHDFNNTGPGNAYTEASLRIGRVETDFSSYDMGVDKASYDSKSTYYGAHIGAGYLWKVMDRGEVDLSAKYLWTQMGSDSVRLNTGDPVKFYVADSHRVRVGGRFTYAAAETVSPYGGVYYDYEFDGKVKGSTYGFGIDAPSLKGGTGIAEIGLSIQPSQSKPLFVDIGIQGYVGTREGVTGTAQLRYQF